VQEAGPFTVVTLRLFMALVALLPFLVIRKHGIPRSARLIVVLCVQGLISTAIPWVLITWAEQYIDSALATVLNGTVPLFTMVLAHLFLHDERMVLKRIMGLAIGLCGVCVLMLQDLLSLKGGGGTLSLLGQGAMLLASIFYACGNIFARLHLRNTRPIFQTFYTMLFADAFMWAVTPYVEAPFTLPSGGLTWVAVVWLGVLGSGLAYFLFYHLLHSIGATRVSMVTYTIPVVGVTLGVVFLKEPLTWNLLAGTLLIVSSIWISSRRS
jgi:drug/metabolite transporter (DMT)-like permease